MFVQAYNLSSKLVGILPLYSYRVSPVPSSGVNKEASGAVHDGSKPCNCFGRDTIANAAAKVGPAVVNIAVPQGIHFVFLLTFRMSIDMRLSLRILYQPCRFLWHYYRKEYRLWNNHQQGWYNLDMCSCCG